MCLCDLGPKLRLGTAYPRSSASSRANRLCLANRPWTSLRNHIPACWEEVLSGAAKQSFEDMRDQAGAWSRESRGGPDLALNVGVTQARGGWTSESILRHLVWHCHPDTQSCVWATPRRADAENGMNSVLLTARITA